MKHNLKTYTDEMLIELCQSFNYSKDIPRWLYCAIHHRGIQEKAQSHMKRINKPRSLDEVIEEAKKYKYRGDFQKGSNWAYQWARKHNVLNEVCKDMKIRKNLKKRCIYIGTFNDGFAYIGLTWETKDRWNRHMKQSNSNTSPIYLHYKETGLKPTFTQLTDYLPAEEAVKEERKYIKLYNGKWKLLNGSSGGELGTSSTKWTKSKVFNTAMKCSSYKEFCDSYPKAYDIARNNDWIREIQNILPPERKTWNVNNIQEAFQTCNTINEVRTKFPSACNAAKRMGIYNILTANMVRGNHKAYTKEEIINYFKTITFKKDLTKGNRSIMNAAIRMGIYNEVSPSLSRTPTGKSLDEYIKLASSYKSRGEFKKTHPGAYYVIRAKGWANKCFAHMTYKCRVNLSNDEIIKGASKYKTKNEWQRNDKGAYKAAKSRGIFDIATKHMQRPTPHNYKPDSYYLNKSSQYNELKTFKLECPNEYAAIIRRGKEFKNKCFSHMQKHKKSYTKEEAFAIAKQYPTRMALHNANLSVYTYLYTKKLLDECFSKVETSSPNI